MLAANDNPKAVDGREHVISEIRNEGAGLTSIPFGARMRIRRADPIWNQYKIRFILSSMLLELSTLPTPYTHTSPSYHLHNGSGCQNSFKGCPASPG